MLLVLIWYNFLKFNQLKGLKNMHALLKEKEFVLRIELEKLNGETAYAEYELEFLLITNK